MAVDGDAKASGGSWPYGDRDLKADPLDRLVETNETDNATSVAIRVDGTRVRTARSAACR